MTRSADRPLLGILLMLGFCAAAPVGDALAKLLGTRMGLGQMIVVRFALQALLLTPLALALGAELRLAPRVMRLTAVRTLLHVAGLWLMFLALRYLPLADAIAIAFVMPFLMLLLGRTVLGEVVGRRRLAACAVGFAGTLMVIQPSFVAVGWAALLPLGVAVVFAFFMLVTRQIARDADPIALQAVSGLMATALVLPALLVGDRLGWPEAGLSALPRGDWTLLILMGVFGSGVHLLMTWSLRFAPTSTLAPMQYLEIPFATVVGYLVFGALPNGLAAVGILVTIGSGLYIIHRERLAAA
jgi:drug/metabolite transporter (DMT)-like permease